MAPRKEKIEEKKGGKASADEAADVILNYLRKQNRPYSATDISANLHNKVSKAAAAKVLKDMHERKEIEGRAAGKQIVYHAIQNPADAATPEELATLDARTRALQDETATAKATERSLKATLSTLHSSLPTPELRAAVASLETARAELADRLTALRSGSVRPVSAAERAAVEAEGRKWEGVERKRRSIVKEVWGFICDSGMDAREAGELKERLGLDEE